MDTNGEYCEVISVVDKSNNAYNSDRPPTGEVAALFHDYVIHANITWVKEVLPLYCVYFVLLIL